MVRKRPCKVESICHNGVSEVCDCALKRSGRQSKRTRHSESLEQCLEQAADEMVAGGMKSVGGRGRCQGTIYTGVRRP